MTDEANHASRVVVTGGAGFIGSHLCDALITMNCEVFCVDNFETGGRRNIDHLLGTPGFRLVQSDVNDGIDIDDIDAVYHFATPSAPSDYILDPVQAMRVASAGVINTLDFAHRQRAKFVLGSTSEIYGTPTTDSYGERSVAHVDPVAGYGTYYEARRFGEAVTNAYRSALAMPTSIVRIFNSYGPRMRLDDGRLVSSLIKQALAGGPLTVPGTGDQRRSLCHVDDTVAGVLALAASPHPGPINVGNCDEISVFSLAQQLQRLADDGTEVTFVESTTDGAVPGLPDVHLAEEVLGWQSKISFEEGLASTMAWFADPLHADV